MDFIIHNILGEFRREHKIQQQDDGKDFEVLATYLVVSNFVFEDFSPQKLITGGSKDDGIDSLAIIVNGQLVTTQKQVEGFVHANQQLDVKFILIQASSAAAFKADKLGSFGSGVRRFFKTFAAKSTNDRTKKFGKIAETLYAHSSNFSRNPEVKMFYVTTGLWNNALSITQKIEEVEDDIDALELFHSVNVKCYGEFELRTLYRRLKYSNSTQIHMSNRIPFPKIPDVDKAYMGLLDAKQFLQLIQGKDGQIQSELFYDNIRHWQRWNNVNSDIKKTLESNSRQALFPLLNNGITIVADDIQVTGDKVHLKDYQIVNGCQTSFVLFHMRAYIDPNLMIPIRLISTKDKFIKRNVIRGNNHQTAVNETLLFSLKDFTKKLEQYFPIHEGDKKLYYERRSKQFESSKDIPERRIISTRILVQSLVSMFLDAPHTIEKTTPELYKNSTIFNYKHRLEPYYLSAYTYYKLNCMFKDAQLPSSLEPARFQIMLTFRVLNSPATLPELGTDKVVRYSQNLINILWDSKRCANALTEAAKHVGFLANNTIEKDVIMTPQFTEKLLDSKRS